MELMIRISHVSPSLYLAVDVTEWEQIDPDEDEEYRKTDT